MSGQLLSSHWCPLSDLLLDLLVRHRGQLRLADGATLEVVDTRKGDQFASTASAKVTNEDNYVVQKFTRAVMGTNSIDHCARL